MSASPPYDGSRDVLAGHLEGLFAFAQIVSSGPDEAAELVEATLRRSRRQGIRLEAADPGSVEHARVELYRILLEVRAGKSLPSVDADVVSTREDMTHLKRRLAEQFVDGAITSSFATLTADERILLMLCDVQRMSCVEAGRVLNLDADAACTGLEKARTALDRSIVANATQVERRLLETALSGNWKREALRRMVDRELSAVPPTLQPTLLSAATGTVDEAPAKPPEKRTDRSGALIRGMKRAVAVLVIIALAGLLGYGFSTMTGRTPDANLITLSAAQAAAVEVGFETNSPEQGERFVRDRLGRRITIPSIRGVALQGIAIREMADGAEAPVIVYGNADSPASVVVYVYSYAFLDAHQLQLSGDVLNQIESEGHFDLHDLGETRALVWRRSDDIYVAVTKGDAEALRDRIRFPS